MLRHYKEIGTQHRDAYALDALLHDDAFGAGIVLGQGEG